MKSNLILCIILSIIFTYFVLFSFPINNNIEGLSFINTEHVDLPLTTNYSCQNMCGPPARCSITGEQCRSDSDCFGCKLPNCP